MGYKKQQRQQSQFDFEDNKTEVMKFINYLQRQYDIKAKLAWFCSFGFVVLVSCFCFVVLVL